MKRTLLVALAVVCLGVSAAGAQPYKVEFRGDNSLSTCSLAGNGVGMTSIHVILTGSGGSMAVLFGAEIPACWAGATWIGDDLAAEVITPTSVDEPEGDEVWLTIGDTQDPLGLAIAFRECRELPLYLGKIDFLGVAAAPCCQFPVTHPSAWTNFATPAQVVDCNFIAHEAAGGSVQVSSGTGCDCQQVLATDRTTWGRVKALYR